MKRLEKGAVPEVDYATYTPRRDERMKYYAACAGGLAFLGWLFFDNLAAVCMLALCAVPLEKTWRHQLAAARRHQLAIQFKDMLFSLSASFQSGRHMSEAIAEARQNLLSIFPAEAPINTELALMTRRIEAGGESDRAALLDFARRSGCEDARNFADVYYTCLTTGGDLTGVVNRAAEVILEKMSIRREIETLMAQKKYESKLLTAIPILILLYLRVSSPAYLEPLYSTAAGVCVMAGALAALVISFFWGNKIMEIEI